MKHLHTPGMRRGGFWPLAPVGAVVAVVGVIAVALVALVTMALFALLPGGRKRVKVFRTGGVPRTGDKAGRATDDHTRATSADNPPDEKAGESESKSRKSRSYAEVVEAWPWVLAAALLIPGIAHAKMLVPMDDTQANHLKAYGLTFWALGKGAVCEWLLNYRGGAFLLPDDPVYQREANIRQGDEVGYVTIAPTAIPGARDSITSPTTSCDRTASETPVTTSCPSMISVKTGTVASRVPGPTTEPWPSWRLATRRSRVSRYAGASASTAALRSAARRASAPSVATSSK